MRRSRSKRAEHDALEKAVGVRFKDKALLRQAFVHRSYLNEHPDFELDNYERLEYLGDAFLGWVVAVELFKRYPSFDEGDLTRARSSIVRGTTLAEVAMTFGAGEHMLLGSGEEATGGRTRRSNLAAVVEAVIGAVLLDRGEKDARKLVLQWLGTEIASLDASGAPRDAKSSLQEECQRLGLPLPVYEVIGEAGPSHARHYTVRVSIDGRAMGEGEGKRKVEAEQAAAAEAKAALQQESSIAR